MQQMTKRIEYIDALRGFTIILVVFSHIELFSFGFESPSFIGKIFASFFMPLFFFISGYVGYKANIVWNPRTWWLMSKKKISMLLLPTFIFALIYVYAYLDTDFTAFITHNYKLGYWFTIVLLEMFLIIYTLNLAVYNSNHHVFRKRILIAIVTTSILLFCTKFILRRLPLLDDLGNILSLHHTFRYFPYFAFGYICSIYKETFYRLILNQYLTAAAIILFSICFYIQQSFIYPYISISLTYRTLDLIIGMLIGFTGLLIVYNVFRTYQESFTKDKKIGKALQYIGKRTLDIYLLHYFFLPSIPQMARILKQGNNISLELALGGGGAIFIIGICLIVSNILRTSPILAKYLFGTK